ncbi:GntR family transcriptional regulator [Ancylobacter sp. Lp-2]|uniref:GntR family transcriptional regulator n=1 Tax=Ancylobacter sp. Lp-2 TaxID=2881339 RepID=UPI001E59A8A3|nr:GntR family transcriptional regulator [Ancylobacter sp. Lp-2]MCB4771490.1 GntR family transcriptional regulator [Ancylobacter sp. Lp-2]
MGKQTEQPELSQARQAYRLIEEMIVTLKLPPGHKISETSLSKTLGIGRTPIREALQRLSFEGTVRIVPRSGVVVSEIDLVEQLGMLEVRRGIESVLAGRAARFATNSLKQEFAAVADAFDKVAESREGAAFVAADREFNTLIIQTANSKYATQAIGPIEAQTRRFWFLYFKEFGDLRRVCELHAAIARKIAHGDEAGAKRASDALMDYVEEYTKKTLRVYGVA